MNPDMVNISITDMDSPGSMERNKRKKNKDNMMNALRAESKVGAMGAQFLNIIED